MAKKQKKPKSAPAPQGSGGALWLWGAGVALAAGVVVYAWGANPAGAVVPKTLTVKLHASYAHDEGAWTQGLLWHNGKLYEGTGVLGQSSLRRVDLKSGAVEKKVRLPDKIFGEGLARVGNRLIQLSWKSGRAFVWDLDSFEKKREFKYDGEGWGLCYSGKKLVMSNGTNRLSLRDPESFAEVGHVRVRRAGRRFRGKLNELECVGETVYANVWTNDEDRIVQIDLATGDITGVINAAGLLPPEIRRTKDVLNGIAFVPERNRFLLTGKYWPKVFEVEFVDP